MSKERELLYRWYRGARDLDDYNELCDKTEELLAQPEPEQEPLSDDDIWQALTKEEVPDYKATIFIRGIKFAEREHGIGEVEMNEK